MKRWIKIALVLIGIGLIAYFVLPVSVPLILAYVTALIFEPLLRWGIRRLKLKRKWMVILTFTTFMIVLLGMTYWFVSRGIAQLIHFAERIPHYTWSFIRHWEQFTESIISMAEELPAPMVEELNSQLDGFLFSITEPLRTFDYLKLATTIGTSLPVFLVSVLVYLIAFFLFMLEMPKLIESFYSHLKQDTAEKFRFMSERFSSVFWGCLQSAVSDFTDCVYRQFDLAFVFLSGEIRDYHVADHLVYRFCADHRFNRHHRTLGLC